MENVLKMEGKGRQERNDGRDWMELIGYYEFNKQNATDGKLFSKIRCIKCK